MVESTFGVIDLPLGRDKLDLLLLHHVLDGGEEGNLRMRLGGEHSIPVRFDDPVEFCQRISDSDVVLVDRPGARDGVVVVIRDVVYLLVGRDQPGLEVIIDWLALVDLLLCNLDTRHRNVVPVDFRETNFTQIFTGQTGPAGDVEYFIVERDVLRHQLGDTAGLRRDPVYRFEHIVILPSPVVIEFLPALGILPVVSHLFTDGVVVDLVLRHRGLRHVNVDCALTGLFSKI